MKISKMRGLAAGAVTAIAVFSSSVGVASAVTAAWNTSDSIVATTTAPLVLKVKSTPTTTVTYSCAPADILPGTMGFDALTAAPSQGKAHFTFQGLCSGPLGPGTAWVSYYGTNSTNPLLAERVGAAFYYLRGTDSAILTINGGGYWQSNMGRGGNYTLPWTNGTNPLAPVSTLTYNNTQVGITSSGQPITLTGVVQLKTAANGLLTLV